MKKILLKWTNEQSLALSRILTIVLLFCAAASLFCIPIITEWYDAVSAQAPIHVVLNIVLYISAFLGITAVWQLFRMLNNITAKKIFVQENLSVLRVISWCCFGVAAIWTMFSFWRLVAVFVAFVAAFAGVILRIMKNLFAIAIEMREENDYTI
ncbi:MAG: DUF2975 domain-containing protein [Oscillospiraceae bacterium]|nr:DUF2975 domain-containing protein [Oscillospiraceae bacterium]